MLILTSKTRKQLLWLWVGFFVPVLLLIFIQTISGKFAEIEIVPWLWVGINLLPGFLLLIVGAIQNRNAGKFVQTFVYRIIFVCTAAYLVLVLMTLFTMTAGSAEQSLADYFQQSYQWLLPFQILLLIVFTLLFFKKEAVFRPNEKIIKGHAEREMKKAQTASNVLQQQAFEQLVANDYDSLFERLRQHFGPEGQHSYMHNDLVLLQGNYNDWKRQTSLGTIASADAQLMINKISMALINAIKKL